MADDPRIFKPEQEQRSIITAINQGMLSPDGNRLDEPPRGPDGLGFRVMLVFLPFITLVVASAAWIGGFAGFSPRFRSVLTGLLPQTWVAVSPDADSNPLAVGIALGVVVVSVLTGLLLARRSLVRRWVHIRGFAAFLAGLGVYAISAATVLVVILTPGMVLVGISIATGADLGSTPLPDDATIRTWPLVLTGIAMAWCALVSTRRAARKRSAYRANSVG